MALSTIISGGTKQTRKEAVPFKWQGSDSDVLVLGVGEEESNIGVETVRKAQSFLSTHPVSREEKLLIIEEAEKLTIEAQNALLKTLEEPPAKASIYLLTINSDLLLPTVLSRCLITNLPSVLPTREGEWDKVLEKLEQADLGERMELASKVAKGRDETISSLESLLVSQRELIISSKSSLKDTHRVRATMEAIKKLKANTNVRLVIENLLINW